MENSKEYKRLRDEYNTVRVQMKDALTKGCCNCGCKEDIELHHIVPLKLGGTNNPSNIVPICHKCHMAAHYGRNIRDYQNKDISGRPTNNGIHPLVALTVYTKYIFGQIGTKQVKKELKMGENGKISEGVVFKWYLDLLGVKKYRNNIDILESPTNRGKLNIGDKTGYIEFKDGTHEDLFFHGYDAYKTIDYEKEI